MDREVNPAWLRGGGDEDNKKCMRIAIMVAPCTLCYSKVH